MDWAESGGMLGVTLYYRGRLAKNVSRHSLFSEAESIAVDNGWSIRRLASGGFVIHAHPDCEPITFDHDANGKVDDWVKTQYAGPEIHKQIVEFLTSISKLFVRFKVDDDTDYWTTRDGADLELGKRQVNEMLEDHLRRNPSTRSVVRMPDGRIIDIIE